MEVGQLWVKLGLDKSGFNSGVDEAKGQSTGLGGFIKNAFEFTVGAGMFDLLKEGIKSAWDMSIGYNSTLEQNKIAFDTMLGSADKAGKLLNQLEEFAAKTPFQFPELADASKKMLAFGFSSSQVMPILKSVGDAASGLGGGSEKLMAITEALGKIQTSGKVSAREMLELTTNGVPAWQILADKMHLSVAQVQELCSKGLIPAKTAINDLVSGMETRFPNMMNKQSKSFSGLMSTLKDNVEMTLGGVLKPAFTELTSTILPKAIDMVSKFGEGFKAGGLQGALKAIFPPEIAGTLINLGKGIQSTFGWLESHGPLIKTILAGVVAGFVAYKIAVMASIAQQEISNALEAIHAISAGKSAVMLLLETGATENATIAQKLLNLAMEFNPIGLIIVAIAALIGVLVYLWNTNEGFRKAIIGAWNAVKDTAVSVFTGIKNFFVGIWDWLKNFFGQWGTVILAALVPFIGIPLLIAQHWQQITAFLSGIWNGIKSIAGTVWNGIKTVVMAIATPFVNAIKILFSGMGSSIKLIMNGIKTFFSSIWLGIKTAILGPVLLIIDLVTGNFGKLKTDALGIFNNLKKSTEGIWNGLGQFFSGIGKVIYTLLSNAWNSIKNYIVTKGVEILQENVERWNSIINFFKALPGKLLQHIKDAWTNMKQTIVQKGAEILQENANRWNSVLSFFGSLPGKFLQRVKDIGTSIKNGFNDAVNFLKNLPNEALQWGEDFVNGFLKGIKNIGKNVKDAVSNIGKDIRSILHFSKPDEGPLEDYESWMPDMIEGMKKGIDNHKGNLINSIKGLASNMALSIKGTLDNTALAGTAQSGQTTINFNGNYGFNSKDDIKYFMNQAALLVQRRK